MLSRARTAAARKAAAGRTRCPSDELVEAADRDPGELADVDHQVVPAAQVAVDDVQPGAVVELCILEALGRIQLAVRRRGVLEQFRERASDVVVVVEDLVVEPAATGVPPHEDLVGGVDHDLPDVVVSEQLGERPVPGEVPKARLCDRVGVRDRVRSMAAAVLIEPVVDGLRDESTKSC